MSQTIAISGKGGSGKTTLAGLAVRTLVERTGRSVLAVDADPNACLGPMLGVEPEQTVGEIRDAALERKLQTGPGMDRQRAVEYAIHRAVAEADGFDLLTMGHTEGPKCYCAVNHLLRKYLDQASSDYGWVVLDNEAGMEHLSRRTTDAVALLLVVAEPTPIGATTARRILGLAERLPVTIRQKGVVWNKVNDAERLTDLAADLPTLATVPFDAALAEASVAGAPVFDLPPDCPALEAVGEALTEALGIEATQPS
ncbi:MAG: AAA family ATPase [Phycisphaerae bacterium]